MLQHDQSPIQPQWEINDPCLLSICNKLKASLLQLIFHLCIRLLQPASVSSLLLNDSLPISSSMPDSFFLKGKIIIRTQEGASCLPTRLSFSAIPDVKAYTCYSFGQAQGFNPLSTQYGMESVQLIPRSKPQRATLALRNTLFCEESHCRGKDCTT